MDNNTQNGLSGGYKIPTKKDVTNANIQKEVANRNNRKSSISESYVIQNNTVK